MAEAYEDLLWKVLLEGVKKPDRTGVGTRSYFGGRIEYDLREGFPLITSKKVFFKGVVAELSWMLRGETNVKALQDENVHIWDEWRRPYGVNGRALVAVEPRQGEAPIPYEGDYSLAGFYSGVSDVDSALARRWLGMMRRVYDPSDDKFQHYGAKGVSVHSRWHDVRTFVSDAKGLPHWEYAKGDLSNFQLDKDYYQSSQYGPDTCVWLSAEENSLYTSADYGVLAEGPDGERLEFPSLNHASRQLEIPNSTLHRFVNDRPGSMKGGNKRWEGWSFERLESWGQERRYELIDGELGPVYGKQYRNWAGTDQIASVLHSLEHDPFSRRHIVSAWNVGQLHEMALAPCHMSFQLNVEPKVRESGNYLDIRVNQRSADMFLGVPFNLAFYGLMLEMFAKHLGYQARKLVWEGGDCHIYNNHIFQVNQQLDRHCRDPRPLPKLTMLGERGSLFDTEGNHSEINFELVNYFPHPAIKAPVAV